MVIHCLSSCSGIATVTKESAAPATSASRPAAPITRAPRFARSAARAEEENDEQPHEKHRLPDREDADERLEMAQEADGAYVPSRSRTKRARREDGSVRTAWALARPFARAPCHTAVTAEPRAYGTAATRSTRRPSAPWRPQVALRATVIHPVEVPASRDGTQRDEHQ